METAPRRRNITGYQSLNSMGKVQYFSGNSKAIIVEYRDNKGNNYNITIDKK
jgi:hypothetical protein